MTTKRAQDSTVHCVFLREELSRFARVFAEFSLSLKDSNFFLISLDKVNKIDVLLEDNLWCERKTLLSNEIRGSKQVATHSATFSKSVRNRVDSQDTTELVPVVDVFFVGPI